MYIKRFISSITVVLEAPANVDWPVFALFNFPLLQVTNHRKFKECI